MKTVSAKQLRMLVEKIVKSEGHRPGRRPIRAVPVPIGDWIAAGLEHLGFDSYSEDDLECVEDPANPEAYAVRTYDGKSFLVYPGNGPVGDYDDWHVEEKKFREWPPKCPLV